MVAYTTTAQYFTSNVRNLRSKPNCVGMKPVMSESVNEIISADESKPSSVGSSVSTFPPPLNASSLLRFPISVGIDETKALSSKNILRQFLRFPSSDGSDPDKEFLLTSKNFSSASNPSSVGSVFESLLCERSNCSKLLQFATSDRIVPLKLLLRTKNTLSLVR